jgi:hypothetical protein
MRTTLTIDDRLAKALKALAHRCGKPFKQVVKETLQAGLAAGEAPAKLGGTGLRRCRWGACCRGSI